MMPLCAWACLRSQFATLELVGRRFPGPRNTKMRCAIRRSLRVREPIASCPRFLTNSLILTINATPSANRELRLPHPPRRGKVTPHANPHCQTHLLDRSEARASAADPRAAADWRLAAERMAGAAQARSGNRGAGKIDR